MRTFLSILLLLGSLQTASACFSASFVYFDWGRPVYERFKKTPTENADFIIGKVVSFHGKTDGLEQESATYGIVKIEVLTEYSLKENPAKEVDAIFVVNGCYGNLRKGQVALFAIRENDGMKKLLSYRGGF